MWFADITVSYHDWNFLSVAPSRRMQGLYTGTRLDGTAVNGWFGDENANAIQAAKYQDYDLAKQEYVWREAYPEYSVDEYGNASYLTTVQVTNPDGTQEMKTIQSVELDANGVPVLKYPYNIMTMQESLAATNPLNRFLIDCSVGKLIYLPNRQSLSINLSVSNLTNNTHFKTGGYQQARLPRAVRQGEKDYQNSVITANAWKYPSKYYYAWGANFFLTVTYKF